MPIERKRIQRPVNKPCSFCETKTVPDYKEPRVLKPFMTDKGKIVSRLRTGICLSHQRGLTIAIKRARYMALLPYVSLAR